MCKTNPIQPGRRRLTQEIVRNEAKLGETGVYGQSRLSCGPCPGRSAERAKRTQFRAADWRPAANRAKRTQFPAGWGGTWPRGRESSDKYAKRTQFAWARRVAGRMAMLRSGWWGRA
jgi:hypothetical protein